MIARAVAVVWIAILFNEALGGLIRSALDALSLVALAYCPFLGGGLLLLLYLTRHLVDLRPDRGAILIATMVSFGMIVALLCGRSLQQTAFGLYTWTPFFLGLLVVRYRQEALFFKVATVLWGIAVAGVFLSALLPLPWIGQRYDILGKSLMVSRDWQSFGVHRLPGFSRASFTAAIEILFGAGILMAQRQSLTRQFAIWSVSFVAILLTTSKMPLIALGLIPLVLVADRCRQRGAGPMPGHVLVALLMAGTVLLPLAAAGGLRPDWGRGEGVLSLASLASRFDDMWPRAFALIDPNAPTLWTGIGFGGIGVSQSLFDPAHYSAGDNLFVFLVVTLGLGGLALLPAFFESRSVPSAWRSQGLMMAVVVLALGLTANVVEAALPCLALGMLVGWRLDLAGRVTGRRFAPSAHAMPG